AAVGLERLGLAAVAVEREHQMRPQSLAQWVLGDELLELGEQALVVAEREPGADVPLARRHPQLLEAPYRPLRERLVGKVRGRAPATSMGTPSRRTSSGPRIPNSSAPSVRATLSAVTPTLRRRCRDAGTSGTVPAPRAETERRWAHGRASKRQPRAARADLLAR